MSFQTELFIPKATFYEVNWWERRMHIDGPFRGMLAHTGRNAMERYSTLGTNYEVENRIRETLKEESRQAAQEYANAVSIGNMTTLRRFLEASLRKTTNPLKYVLHFELMFTKDDRDALRKRMRTLLGSRYNRITKTNLEQVIKSVMGFTRKRELLIPEWADDKRLWVPDKSIGS